MTLNHVIAVMTLGSAFLLSLPAMAQDDLPLPGYQESRDPVYSEDRPLISEPEKNVRSSSGTTAQSFRGDSTRVSTASKSKPNEEGKSRNNAKKEEDALSFNFLYYIIQKFKISDIVDQ